VLPARVQDGFALGSPVLEVAPNGSDVYVAKTAPVSSVSAIVDPSTSVSSVRRPAPSVRVKYSSTPSPVSSVATAAPACSWIGWWPS